MKVGGNPPISPGDDNPLLGGINKKLIINLAKNVQAMLIDMIGCGLANLTPTGKERQIEAFFAAHPQEAVQGLEKIKSDYEQIIAAGVRSARGGEYILENLTTTMKSMDEWLSESKDAFLSGQASSTQLWGLWQLCRSIDTDMTYSILRDPL